MQISLPIYKKKHSDCCLLSCYIFCLRTFSFSPVMERWKHDAIILFWNERRTIRAILSSSVFLRYFLFSLWIRRRHTHFNKQKQSLLEVVSLIFYCFFTHLKSYVKIHRLIKTNIDELSCRKQHNSLQLSSSEYHIWFIYSG